MVDIVFKKKHQWGYRKLAHWCLWLDLSVTWPLLCLSRRPVETLLCQHAEVHDVALTQQWKFEGKTRNTVCVFEEDSAKPNVKQQGGTETGSSISCPQTHKHTLTLVLPGASTSSLHDSSLLTHRSSAQHGNEWMNSPAWSKRQSQDGLRMS